MRWELCKQFAGVYAAMVALVLLSVGIMVVVAQNAIIAQNLHDTTMMAGLWLLLCLCIVFIVVAIVGTAVVARCHCYQSKIFDIVLPVHEIKADVTTTETLSQETRSSSA